jgi:hypothetical protein
MRRWRDAAQSNSIGQETISPFFGVNLSPKSGCGVVERNTTIGGADRGN